MDTAPDINHSTEEERRNYIKEKFPCMHIFAVRDPLRTFPLITDNRLSKAETSGRHCQNRIFNEEGLGYRNKTSAISIAYRRL